MCDLNEKRVVYYGRNDYAAGACRDRCLSVLTSAESVDPISINDAIEAHQIKLTADGIPELFQNQSIEDYPKRATILFSRACRFVSSELEDKSVGEIYDQVELQYREEFWGLVEACGAWQKMKAPDFEKVLMGHQECIGIVLQYKKAVDCFVDEIKRALINNPSYSAELIVSRLAAEVTSEKALNLPQNLGSSEIDDIMLSYINSEAANPNYLSVLRNWPSGKVGKYNPSPEVRVKAKRQYDRSMDDLLRNGTGLRYSTGVTIDMTQFACKGMMREGLNLTHSFSGRWLQEYMDPATVMNNLIYVFDFVDSHGLMRVPARQHEEHDILATLGMHVKGRYHETTGLQMRSGLVRLEIMAYATFLEKNGARLESAIEWVYNHYFAEEFDITGFSLALPSGKATWLDKCKAIGPEIERAVKAYSLYSKYGAIEDEYFPYESVRSFSSVMALKGKKYAIAGSNFERFGDLLFSDQCMLSYSHAEEIEETSFFKMMVKHSVTRGDYPEYLQPYLSELVENGFVAEHDEDGRLMPTDYAVCLKILWEHDAVPLFRLGERDLDIIKSLADRDVVGYCDRLFAPFEANYLDYMFNDASYPNSIGLRNRYDHASSSIEDPQDNKIKDDYYRLLSLLISITLKINEELMRVTGRGGLDSFVDWPYYGESVFRMAEELELSKRKKRQLKAAYEWE